MDACYAYEVIAVCLNFAQEVRLVLEVVEVDLASVELLVCCGVGSCCYELDDDALLSKLGCYILDDLRVRNEVNDTLKYDLAVCTSLCICYLCTVLCSC